MVTATIAGLVLNWATPFFLLATLATVGTFFVEEFNYGWWRYVFSGLLALSIAALVFYAFSMRLTSRIANAAGLTLGMLAALTLACAALWGVHAIFPGFFDAFLGLVNGEWTWSSIWVGGTTLSVAAVAGAVPVIIRVLPWFEKPETRAVVLKIALGVAGLLIPFCAVIVFLILCSLGAIDAQAVPGWPLPKGAALFLLVLALGFVFPAAQCESDRPAPALPRSAGKNLRRQFGGG